ncbi:MAG TPA: hypothetical protein VHY08_26580 [Bacillota bacterium]|nr:hypothetical protein [Bacillota bacterium]
MTIRLSVKSESRIMWIINKTGITDLADLGIARIERGDLPPAPRVVLNTGIGIEFVAGGLREESRIQRIMRLQRGGISRIEGVGGIREGFWAQDGPGLRGWGKE